MVSFWGFHAVLKSGAYVLSISLKLSQGRYFPKLLRIQAALCELPPPGLCRARSVNEDDANARRAPFSKVASGLGRCESYLI